MTRARLAVRLVGAVIGVGAFFAVAAAVAAWGALRRQWAWAVVVGFVLALALLDRIIGHARIY